jgi:hypothetical protein
LLKKDWAKIPLVSRGEGRYIVYAAPRVLCVDQLGNRQAFILAVALRRAILKEKDLVQVKVEWAGISEEQCIRTVSDLVLGSLTTLGFGAELRRISADDKFEGYPISTVIDLGSCDLIICTEEHQASQVRAIAGKKPVIISVNHPALILPEKPPAEEYFACTKRIVEAVTPPILEQLRDMLVPA